MERYESYKDSGIEWIGEIPNHWRSTRISSLYDSRNEKVSEKDYRPLSVTMRGIVPQLETAAKTQDGDSRKLVRKGDFVINSRSDRRGSCGVSPMDGSVSLISNVLSPKNNLMVSEYFDYLFHSEAFADEFYKWGTGIVDDLWSTNWSRMKNILVCLPDGNEQKAIADYLDDKTAEIDGLIEKTEKSIELLEEYRKSVISEVVTKGLNPDVPMKDSGIDWIGEIPAHWHKKKIKHMLRAIGGATPSKDVEDYWKGDIPWISSMEVKNDEILDTSLHITTDALNSCSCELCESGTLVMVVRSGILKHTIPISIIRREMTVNQDIKAIKVNKGECLAEYFQYFVRGNNDALLSIFSKVGSTVDSFEFDRFINADAFFPEIEEQKTIVQRLKAAFLRIDSLVSAKRETVARLREYRKSLISEAVTGKFKVPGVE